VLALDLAQPSLPDHRVAHAVGTQQGRQRQVEAGGQQGELARVGRDRVGQRAVGGHRGEPGLQIRQTREADRLPELGAVEALELGHLAADPLGHLVGKLLSLGRQPGRDRLHKRGRRTHLDI
jgi:hypothetical protein